MNNSTLTIKEYTEVDLKQLTDITIIYCRLSAEDGNEGESYSIANQKLILSKVAEKENLSNPILMADDGFSGSNFNRPAMVKALELVEAGKVKNFIVKDLSRLGRDYLRVGQLLESVFPQHGIRFISLNEQVDSLKISSQDAYMLPLMNIFNEWYSRQCSEKIRMSKHTKAKAGEKIGWQAPYGYLNNPENRKEWLVDKEAAKIIQRIFREFVSGKTPSSIARGLANDKILLPSFHKKKLGLKSAISFSNNPYLWKAETVLNTIDREEYTGATVNLRTRKLSHKQARSINTPREEWLIFQDTHEPIIDKDTFETARKMRQHKRVPQYHKFKDVKGHENLFAGLVFCENGHKMTFCPQQKNHRNLDHYKCGKYKGIKETCNHGHYIRKIVLEEIVLKELQFLIHAIDLDESKLANQLRQNCDIVDNKEKLQNKNRLIQAEERYEKIDQIIQNLYEDKLSGELTNVRFSKLSKDYETEQTKLTQQIQELQQIVSKQDDQSVNIERFLRQVRKYTDMTELTPEIVNTLINRIIIHTPVGRGKQRQIKIEIHYNFIGQI
ncbi:recombinase family protein [Enterococcus malodoratus]|uniref:Recombinase n=1 Tax=Enterococcus malodoratus ATCC 43197 TaxID=1158601 RepID=R2QYF5_9ENTE|nr:recombinase family protein [Enterococcus malodoratus]EOH73441.1 hypothetical protein UAI_03632 [Enterococcus malodoratus ATCC 43197]EOT67294.1 hypothetical protein I585_02815 [Enterococcus malodoratus ATCC 43197]OJG57992.1 hypothetical protein RV07_GL003214 [Enterococcus malodoratus]SPX03249.1 resolvase family site-specific recombinase [Enterococcus malodoratus]STD69454.1 resolvase family site-specific recombinase [Enterococcus malodoratus]